jgi:hypothetical protein
MRRHPGFIILLLVVSIAASSAYAQHPAEIGHADRAAIRKVIEDQMAAFRRDDGQAAFAFASPMIQSMFGSAETFIAMVRGGYMAVYRPRTVEFGALTGDRESPVQLVHVVGPDGVPAVAAYEMIRVDGRWRINGCVLLPSRERAS